MKKTIPKLYRVGDENLFLLFDTGEMEHVCELIKNSCDPVPKGCMEGYRANLANSLATILLPSVELIIHRLYETGRGANATEFEPAHKFKDCIEAVARILKMRADDPCTEEETEELAELLRDSWTRFIAQSSAYRMYADLPKELAKAETTSKRQSSIASRTRKKVIIDGKEVLLTKAMLEAHRDKFERKKGTLWGWPSAAKLHFKIDVTTIKKIIEE